MKRFFIRLLLVLISAVEVITLLIIHILQFYVPTKVENANIRVFYLMSRVNKTRFSDL